MEERVWGFFVSFLCLFVWIIQEGESSEWKIGQKLPGAGS